MISELELEKRAKRHTIILIVRCDLMNWDWDPSIRGWPATIKSDPHDFFPGFVRVIPHSAGGRKLCAALQRGDLLRYRLGFNIYSARVGYKGNVTGQVYLHAFDISNQLIRAARLEGDGEPIGASLRYAAPSPGGLAS
jgi:hypothetical protein